MNSWSNHLPKAVGALGALLLIYSMYGFFRRPDIIVPMPVKPHTPPRADVAEPAKPGDKYAAKTWSKPSDAQAQAERVMAERKAKADREIQEREEARARIPREYLSAVDLKMYVPDDMEFGETKNERMRLLIGMRAGRPELFVASGKQKMTPEQARAELEDQMSAYGVKVNKQDTSNNSSVGAATTFKGKTGDGGDFRAQYFFNPSNGQGYMVMMMGKDLDRQPARTRQIFDSLQYER